MHGAPIKGSAGSAGCRVLCLVALALWTTDRAQAVPQPLDGHSVLLQFQRWLDGTRDLQARFQQTLLSGALGTGLQESGRMYLLRPGRLRWDYLEPERKVALVRDNRTSLYLKKDAQLWLGHLQDSGGLLPDLLAGQGRLDEMFEATLQTTPAAPPEGAYQLRLVPRKSEESFEELVLTLRAPQFAIEEAQVLDRAGNRMRYRFSGLRRNRGLSPSLFDFNPPPGTEIIDRR